jgi:hypothetical protein
MPRNIRAAGPTSWNCRRWTDWPKSSRSYFVDQSSRLEFTGIPTNPGIVGQEALNHGPLASMNVACVAGGRAQVEPFSLGREAA